MIPTTDSGPPPTPVPRPPDPEPAGPARSRRGEVVRREPEAGSGSARLMGIDAARGVALLGMMAVHSLVVVDAGGPTAVWEIAGGRAAALFALLAGVGIAFTTRRARVPASGVPSAAAGLLARAAVIGLIGLALGGVVDPEVAMVILPFYAVLFVMAIPLVMLPTAVLGPIGVMAAVVLPFVSHDLRSTMPVAVLGNPGFGDLVTDPVGLLRELVFTGLYPAFTWIAYVAVGIAVGRLRLSSRRVAAILAVCGTSLAVLASSASSLLLTLGGAAARLQGDATAQGMSAARYAELITIGGDGVTPPTTLWWLALNTRHTGTPFDLLHTIGTSLAVIGLLLLLAHIASPMLRPLVATVQYPLAAAGAMTLTVYTLHLLFLTSNLDTYSPTTGYVMQVVVVLLGAMAWRASAGRGPLERLVSRVAGRASAGLAPARR